MWRYFVARPGTYYVHFTLICIKAVPFSFAQGEATLEILLNFFSGIYCFSLLF